VNEQVVDAAGKATFPLKLGKALLRARNAAVSVEKKGPADEGYKFVRSVDVDAEAQRLLKKSGLIVLPKGAKPSVQLGRESTLVHVELLYEVIHASSGESVVLSWAGAGLDNPGDKALYKALTGGRKYFIKELLGIPFGIDPEEGAGAVVASNDDEAEPSAIEPERVARICAQINASSLSSRDVVEMLGEYGIEMQDGVGVSGVLAGVKSLTDSQADEVEAHLEKRAQDDAALVPDPEPAGVA
jgi:hypothetical protein